MTFYMHEGMRKQYLAALDDAGSAVAAAGVAARFAGLEIDESKLELIAEAVLGHADDRLSVRQADPREMWEDDGYRDHRRQAMRRQLLEAVTANGHVPIALPAETVRHVKIAPPFFGAEVLAGADWDLIEVCLEVGVRTPPVDRAAAVRAGLLTGGTPAS